MKNNIKTKRLIIRLWVFCGVFLAFSVVFAIRFLAERNEYSQYRRQVNGQAFTVLCEYMNSLEVIFSNAADSADEDMAVFRNDISAYCEGAKSTLGLLFLPDDGRARFRSFLSESRLFFEYIAEKTFAGNALLTSERTHIAECAAYAKKLSDRLNLIYTATSDSGNIDDFLRSLSIDPPPDPQNLKNFLFSRDTGEKTSPISANGKSKQKTALSANLTVNEKNARNIAKKYLGQFAQIRLALTDDNIYRFASGSGFIDIQKQSGLISRLSLFHVCKDIALSETEARYRAETFLREIGAVEMTALNHTLRNGRCDIDYLCEINDSHYNIRIGVTLDRGRITYYSIM